MEALIKQLAGFGFEGLVVGIVFGLLFWVLKTNTSERTEHRKEVKGMVGEFQVTIKENTKRLEKLDESIDRQSNMLSEVSGMLKK